MKCEPGPFGEKRGLRRLGTPHASDWESCKQRGVDATHPSFFSFEGALGYFRPVFAGLTRCQVCHSLSQQLSLLSLPVPSLSHAGSNRQALRTMRSCFKHAVNSSFLKDTERHLNFGELVVVSSPGLHMCMYM